MGGVLLSKASHGRHGQFDKQAHVVTTFELMLKEEFERPSKAEQHHCMQLAIEDDSLAVAR